jgi:hypothetical protein
MGQVLTRLLSLVSPKNSVLMESKLCMTTRHVQHPDSSVAKKFVGKSEVSPQHNPDKSMPGFCTCTKTVYGVYSIAPEISSDNAFTQKVTGCVTPCFTDTYIDGIYSCGRECCCGHGVQAEAEEAPFQAL